MTGIVQDVYVCMYVPRWWAKCVSECKCAVGRGKREERERGMERQGKEEISESMESRKKW